MQPRTKRAAWDRHAIKAEIHRRGKGLYQLAVEAGLEPSAVSVALLRPNQGGETAISTFLGVPVDELFRYRTAPSPGEASTAADNAASRIRDAVSTGAAR